jgi:hypothetical protein
MKNSRRKTSKTLLFILSTLLVAGLILIFQLAKADTIPALNFQSAYPPPEDTPVDFISPAITPLPTYTQTPTPVVLENGWYLYEDQEAGYSFGYPPDAFFLTSHEGGLKFKTARIQFTMLKGQGYQGMVLDVLSNETHQPIDNIIQEMYTTPILNLSLDSINATVEKISIADHPAYLTTYQPFMFELCIFVPYEDYILFIVPVHDNLDNAGSPEALKLFWEIVKTIKFKE